MLINFFFRKAYPGYFSIESVFNNVIKDFSKDLSFKSITLPNYTSGIKNIIKNIAFAVKNQGSINHVTGDVNYISIFLNRKRTILTFHDLESILTQSIFKRIIFYIFWIWIPVKRLKYITVISEATKHKLIKLTRVNPNKIFVIYNGIPSEFVYTPKDFNKDCPTILQVGTTDNKNISRLLNAIKSIKCKLIIVGKLNDSLRELLVKNELNYTNYFNVSVDELVKIYKDSDIVTFISLFEGFGLPIIEAQATGRPVITSNLSSMPEIAGKGALFVDPYNVENIREGILELIQNEKLRMHLVEEGLSNIQRFKPELIAKMYMELYEKVEREAIA